jgi:phosphoenolpyruvate carboxykinase (ATP)
MNRIFGKNITKRAFMEKFEIPHSTILRNPSVEELYSIGSSNYPVDSHTRPTVISSTGAMAAYSGTKTGRSPKDKRIVCDETTKDEVWWDGNRPISPQSFDKLEERAKNYMKTRPRLYVVDGYAGWEKRNRQKIRVYCLRAYHALFMQNMLIMPTKEELMDDFDEVDYTIFNAGEHPSSRKIEGVDSDTTIALNLAKKKMVILGSQYAGEMKKGIFSVMNYLMPKREILSMHASANEGETGDVTLLFGLSGTGKTTLSADPKRRLIGDDEHCWNDEGIFNIEGGCYAKCVGLSEEKEPDIFKSIKYGSVLENVRFKDFESKVVNYDDVSITENTRVSYPLTYIKNCKIPAVGAHPKNIIFLTCDAYGVLPPVSKLSYEQAMYHFISGYTAKVSGTEQGVKEPSSTFSSCFGEAFLCLHPVVYAELLAEKMKKHKTNAWLINTGWTGGKYGIGKRIDLNHTRKILDVIHEGKLQHVPTSKMDIFNLDVPEHVDGVPTEILRPENTWTDKGEYQKTMKILAIQFVKNFKKYESRASDFIKNAGPIMH